MPRDHDFQSAKSNSEINNACTEFRLIIPIRYYSFCISTMTRLSSQSLRPLLFSPSTFLGRSQSLLTTLSTDTPVNCKRLFYNLGERSYGSPANLPNLSEYLFIRDRVSQEERRIIAGRKGVRCAWKFFLRDRREIFDPWKLWGKGEVKKWGRKRECVTLFPRFHSSARAF